MSRPFLHFSEISIISTFTHQISEEGSLRSRLKRGTIGTLFLRLSATGLSFLTSILLARLLGVEEYGVYAYVMALITLLGIPVTLGLPNLVVRHVAAYHAQSSWPLMRGILQWANKLVALISIAVILVAGLVAWSTVQHYDTDTLYTFCLALVFLLPIRALSALRASALRGLHHVVLGQLPENLVRPGLFVVLLLITYLFIDREASLSDVMRMHVATAILGFLLGAWLLWIRIPKGVRNSSPIYDTDVWLKSALAFLFIAGLRAVNNQLAILMLGPLEGVEAVGLYRIATRTAELVTFVLMAVNLALAPTVSNLYTSNQLERLQRIVTVSARIIFGASFPIALVLIVYGRQILEFVYGSEFGAGATALAILSAGQMINAGMGSVVLLLNMTAYEKDTAKGLALAAVISVVLNAFLIPRWGIEGAAVATTASTVTWNLLLAIWTYKRLGIHTTAFGKLF